MPPPATAVTAPPALAPSTEHSQQLTVKTNSAVSAPSCVCKICDCGKHRCGRPQAITNAPLSSDTEYNTRYHIHEPTYGGRMRPPRHSSTSDQPLSSSTESRDQYVSKTLPPRYAPPRRQHIPNPAHLESETGYRAEYQRWDLPRREKHKTPEEFKSPGAFEGISTNTADFRRWPVSQRYFHPKAQYIPNKARIDGESSYMHDYVKVPVSMPQMRPPETYVPSRDDREFRSTMRHAYVGYPPDKRYVHPKQQYTPNKARLDGESTTHHDYAAPVGATTLASCRPAYRALEKQPFSAATEYSDIYTPKSCPRYYRAPATYVPNDAKFSSSTTMRSDFLAHPDAKRCADFKPNNAYIAAHDDRDWMTQTATQHGRKIVPVCAVVKAVTAAVAKSPDTPASATHLVPHADGHIYIQ